MAELTFKQQEQLDAGSFVNETLFGDFIAEFGGMYNSSKSSHINGAHYDELCNLLESMQRRLANCFQGYVYKDSTDTALQYSVKGFSQDVLGVVGVYAGQVNRGPLTASVANYVYADVTNPAAIIIGSSTTGWPAVLHIKLAVITPPASGSWKNQHIVRWPNRQAIALSGVGADSRPWVDFAYNAGGGQVKIGTVPAGRMARVVDTIIETAFDGSAPTLSIGDAGNHQSLMATSEIDPKTAQVYSAKPMKKFTVDTDIYIYITPSTATVGAGKSLLEIA